MRGPVLRLRARTARPTPVHRPPPWRWTACPGASCWGTWRPPTATPPPGGRPASPPASSGYGHWAARLERHTRSGGFDGDLAYWTRTCRAPAGIPVDRPGPNTHGTAATVTVRLGRTETDALLRQVPDVYRTQVNDVLLSALGRTLARWSGRDTVLIGVEGHGREDLLDDLDLSRTVGWFTAEFPLALSVAPDADWRDTLRSVKEQLRAVPLRGLSYGALRHLAPENRLPDAPAPRVGFNYHGQWDIASGDRPSDDGLYRAALPPAGQDTDPDETRTYLLDVTGVVQDGRARTRLDLPARHVRRVHRAPPRRGDRRGTDATSSRTAPGRTPAAVPRPTSRSPGSTSTRWTWSRATAGRSRTSIRSPRSRPACSSTGWSTRRAPTSTRWRVRIAGVADPHAFAAAWQTVADRTPALRSSVRWQGLPTSPCRSCTAAPSCPSSTTTGGP